MARYTVQHDADDMVYRVIDTQTGEPVQGHSFRSKTAEENAIAAARKLNGEKGKLVKVKAGKRSTATTKPEAPPTIESAEKHVWRGGLGDSPDISLDKQTLDTSWVAAQTWAELVTEVGEEQKLWQDHDGKRSRSRLGIGPDEKLRFIIEDKDLAINETGLRGLVDFTDIPWEAVKYCLRNDYTDDLVRFVNRELDDKWSDDGDGKGFLARTRDDVVSYVASERYGVLDNDEVLGLVGDTLRSMGHDPNGGGGVLVSNVSHGGDGNLRVNLLFPSTFKTYPDSDWGIGANIHNSMIGQGSTGVGPFAQRNICLNGAIWGKRDSTLQVKRVHRGDIDRNALMGVLRVSIEAALTQGESYIALCQSLKDVKVTDPEALIVTLCKGRRVSIPTARAWAKAIGSDPGGYKEPDAFTVLNALTLAAQSFEGDRRFELETLAGELTMPGAQVNPTQTADYWNSQVKAASTLSAKDREKYLAPAR